MLCERRANGAFVEDDSTVAMAGCGWSHPTELRSTEIDLFEPAQPHRPSAACGRLRQGMKVSRKDDLRGRRASRAFRGSTSVSSSRCDDRGRRLRELPQGTRTSRALHTGSVEPRESAFRAAIARDSSYAEPHAELALGHFISGMLAAFEHSHALAPWFAITSGRLAAVLRTLGQNTRADAGPDLKHPTSSHAAVISQLRKSSRTPEGPQRARFAFGS